jgi:hypothetical protein
MPVAYKFEARGIQRFILEGGKLKDLVGGSELVDSLCRAAAGDLLDHVLSASGMTARQSPTPESFSRRAGGSFVLHLDDTVGLAEFRALWTLVVAQYAPGLEFTDAIATGKTHREAADSLRESSSRRRAAGNAA